MSADGGPTRDESDFSKAERSKFHCPDPCLTPPLRLEPEILGFLTACAGARHHAQCADQLLRKDIELIRAVVGSERADTDVQASRTSEAACPTAATTQSRSR